jgi:hypothetical protein
MIWFLSLLISLATVLYIASPFLLRRRVLSAAVDASALQGRCDMLLRSLKDLEFEHRTGKIDSDEFRTIRSSMVSEAASVMALLESPAQAKSGDENVEDEAELLIKRARRQTAGATKSNKSSKNGKTSKKIATWNCRCGRTMSKSDAFCASCGRPRSS